MRHDSSSTFVPGPVSLVSYRHAAFVLLVVVRHDSSSTFVPCLVKLGSYRPVVAIGP